MILVPLGAIGLVGPMIGLVVRVDVALAVAEGSGATVGGVSQVRGHRFGAERVLLGRRQRGG